MAPPSPGANAAVIVGSFSGGLRLPALKPAPAPVRRLPIPPLLRVPLLQHAGAACLPCVAIGDRVRRFQPIGRRAEDALGANVHAPASGVVVGLESGPVALPGIPEALHVVIEVDPSAAEAWRRGDEAMADEQRLPPLDAADAPIDALLARMADAGVVGLGGAGFPTVEKLVVPRRLLILNGAECEPVVASDEALLRERAAEVLAGGRLLAHLCGATRIVIALEQRTDSALPALRAALAADAASLEAPAPPAEAAASATAARPPAAIELAILPDRYPAGGERQLIEAIAGIEVPDRGLPRDVGVLVHNVATAAAAWRAAVRGEPLVSRFVTVGGDGLDGSATFEVALGTPAVALGDALGGWRADAAVLRAGGPMMGVALPHDEIAVGKTTIALTAWLAADTAALPCIRCGDCAGVCPSRLQPQLIHARLAAGDAAGADALGLSACIECGACDAVCPSAIPLTAGFQTARAASRRFAHQRRQAEAAMRRFEARVERLRREADEAAAAQAQRIRRLSGAAAAALAKARAKRDAESP